MPRKYNDNTPLKCIRKGMSSYLRISSLFISFFSYICKFSTLFSSTWGPGVFQGSDPDPAFFFTVEFISSSGFFFESDLDLGQPHPDPPTCIDLSRYLYVLCSE